MIRYGKNTNGCAFGVKHHINTMHTPIHWHSFYEIEVCIDGEGVQYINGVAGEFERGVVTFLSPNDFHRIELTKAPVDILNMYFFSYFLTPEMISLISEYDPPFCIKLEGDELQIMIDAIESLKNDALFSDDLQVKSVKCRLSAICIDIIRKALQGREHMEENMLSIKENKTFNVIVRDAIPYINSHLSNPPTRSEMARMLYLNPTYFSEAFKKRLGISYSEYVINARMAEAMRLLKYSDRTVMEVMSEIGYRSPTAFYRQFKDCYGILPGEVNRYK